MDEELRNALYKAYVGEAKAALRLKVFADVAQQEGYPQMARLFRVIAFSEEIHGARALKVLKNIGTTEENLKESFESESRVAGVAYNDFMKIALERGDKAAELHFSQSRDVEEGHETLYKNALQGVIQDRTSSYYVCKVCGYVAEDALPESCPVCGAPQNQFVSFKGERPG